MEDSQRAEATERRRTRSCAECRRRRIRCDGQTVPCSQCVYYQVVDRCHYPQRRERRVPTTKYALLSLFRPPHRFAGLMWVEFPKRRAAPTMLVAA